MANEEHLKILKQGVEVWNRWRRGNPSIRPDLSGAKLSKADLIGVDFSRTCLRGAYLRAARLAKADLREADLIGVDLPHAHLYQADLRKAELIRADLSEANLSEAYLFGADLSKANLVEAQLGWASLSWAHLIEADLREANLGGVDLRSAFLVGADLREADLSGALMGRTILADVDLSAVKGLEEVKHFAPSTIGIETIYRSNGKIPEDFLRGVGAPDTLITYVASLIGRAPQYYSCFLSYCHMDEDFSKQLYVDLQERGVRCWRAPEDVRAGEKLYNQIKRAIRRHDKLLLVLSEHSMQSQWVTTEICRARDAEIAAKRRKLFPVRLVDWDTIKDWECFDADTGKDLAAEVREYFIPDFSNWRDHDSYQKAFDRLLRDLKAEEG